jgi:hypothetical protein
MRRNATTSLVFSTAACVLLVAGQAYADHLTAQIALSPSAQMTTDHVVLTLAGTYLCGPLPQPQPTIGGTFAGLNATVWQAQGRDLAQGTSGITPVCDGAVHEFQLTVLASAFPWRGGQARAIAQLFVQQCDEFFNCEQVTGSTNVKIQIRGGGE